MYRYALPLYLSLDNWQSSFSFFKFVFNFNDVSTYYLCDSLKRVSSASTIGYKFLCFSNLLLNFFLGFGQSFDCISEFFLLLDQIWAFLFKSSQSIREKVVKVILLSKFVVHFFNHHFFCPQSLVFQDIISFSFDILKLNSAILNNSEVFPFVLPLNFSFSLLLLKKEFNFSNGVLGCRSLFLIQHDALSETAVLILQRFEQWISVF